MEHYFIRICNGNICREENTIAFSFINSLLASPENISLVHSVPILECTSSYIAVINTQSEKPVEWIKTNSEISSYFLPFENITSPISAGDEESICEDVKDTKHDPCKEIENERTLDQLLSSHLHNLADELPVSGSFKLDIIIHQSVLNGLSVRKDCLFVMSLYRLYRWHSAHTTFITSPAQDQSHLKEWCSFVDAEIVDSESSATLGPLVWRGSLKLNNIDVPFPGFQLRVDPLESEIKLSDDSAKSELIDSSEKNFILSPTLNVIQECNFYSIPPYLILPVAFRLNICLSNMFNEKSRELLECIFLSDNATAVIVRLHFTTLCEKPKPDKSFSTLKWHKTFSAGKLKDPDNYPAMDKFLTLAVTKSPKSGKVVAHPLRGPGELNARCFFSHSQWLQAKNIPHSQDKNSTGSNVLPSNLPTLSRHAFESIINKCNSFKEKCCKNHHSSSDGSCCMTAFLENVNKTPSGHSLNLNMNEIQVIKEDLDPNDWPERVWLFQKQLEAENEKINAPPNVLTLQHSKKNTFTFSCEDVDKYFLPTGESKIKEAEDYESAIVIDSTKAPKQDVETIVKTEWPESLTCKFEDIYYNRYKQSEDKEAMGNKMVHCYVQDETACTCNNAQLKPNAPIIIRPKSQPSNQKHRSPATPRGVSRLKRKLERSADPSKSAPSQSIGASNLKRSLSNSSIDKEGKKLGPKKQVGRNMFPIRSSPRKKVPVNYSQTTSKGVTRHHSLKEPFGMSRPMHPSKLRRTVSSTSVPSKSNGIHQKTKRNLSPKKKASPHTSSPRKKNSQNGSQSSARNSEKPKRNSDPQQLPDMLRKKLRVAVASALENNGINLSDDLFQPCGKKLFAICHTFVQDIPQEAGISKLMQKIADSHVKQVIEFEKLKL